MPNWPHYARHQQELPTVRSNISGTLNLELPENLATQIADAVANEFTSEPTPDGPRSVGHAHWWWEPLTTTEAAAFLKTSKSTVYSLRKEGRIPASHALRRGAAGL